MSLDINNNGSLSLDEIKKGLEGKENEEALLQMMQAVDTGGSGEINYTEFLAATIDSSIFMRDDYLKTAFMMFDKGKTGKIDNQEIKTLLDGEDVKEYVSKEAILAAIEEVD